MDAKKIMEEGAAIRSEVDRLCEGDAPKLREACASAGSKLLGLDDDTKALATRLVGFLENALTAHAEEKKRLADEHKKHEERLAAQPTAVAVGGGLVGGIGSFLVQAEPSAVLAERHRLNVALDIFVRSQAGKRMTAREALERADEWVAAEKEIMDAAYKKDRAATIAHIRERMQGHPAGEAVKLGLIHEFEAQALSEEEVK